MIAINGRFLTQKLTGVQRYAYELSCVLKRILRDDCIILTPPGQININEMKNLETIQIGTGNGYFWEQIELPFYLNKIGTPLLLNFCNMAPIFYKNKIVTVHDITFIKYPHDYPKKMTVVYKAMIPVIHKKSRAILTVSNFSKSELMDYYNIPRHRIKVVYNAVNPIFKYQRDSDLAAKKYILVFASTGENKNMETILKVFKEILQKRSDMYLYVIGDCQRSEKYNVCEQTDHIIFFGRVSDNNLIKLYSNAMVFLYPSLYEGFGIPVIEAQACQCPVVATNCTTFPEILGQSAILCEPYDNKEMVSKILHIIDDVSYRNELVNKGIANVKRFSWEKSGLKVKELIDQLHSYDELS